MSNVPIPPSPGPSRPRPGYGGYQPSHGSSLYANGTANSGRFRGDSWRSEPTYRPRDPNADHYEPDYGDERPRFGWGASYPQSQTYDPSDICPRRDIMAERMFEPSDSWKHGCVPDPELDMVERFGESRGRMPPPREDYAYPYNGDSYRAGTPYMSRRDLTYPRSTDYYRPGYTEEARWGSSFPLDGASNWARQRSPSTTSRPRGRSDCRDMSYERSLSGSPRSSHFSSPKRSRAGASRRAPSPSSSSIRSSRERSKSPPRSRDRSRSSVRSSAGSRSFTADPPVRSPVQRSHPMAFATPLLPPFRHPWFIPMSQDLTTALLVILRYPYVPLHHLIFSVDDNASLNADFPELHRADTVTPKLVEEIRLNPNTSQQGYQQGRSKRKRRGGVNRKKRGFQHPAGAPREIPNDSNATPFPPNGQRGFTMPFLTPAEMWPISSPVNEFKAPGGSFVPVAPEPEMHTTVVSKEAHVTADGLETKTASAMAPELPLLVTLKLEEESAPSLKQPEVLVTVTADTSLPEPGEVTPPNINKQQPSSPVMAAVEELPKLVIPPPEPPVEPILAPQNTFLEVSDSPTQSQSTLFSPVPARATAVQVPPSQPSLEPCSMPQSLPVSGLTEVTTSSPVSSVAPTPSLQTPSPPHTAPDVIVAPPTVKEPEDELVRPYPIAQSVCIPFFVRSDPDIFPPHAKEAESLAGALRIVVGARLQLDLQSREERVNPILMANQAVAAASPDVPVPSAETLVQEVLAGQRAQETTKTFYSHVRDSLVASMTIRQETVDEKVTRLRKEYLALHREWVARCAELDNSHRVDPAAGEVAAIPARTTRRSAAVLGDAVRSDLEMEQIIASLGNDELYDPAHLALRNLAVIPDMLSVTHGKVDAVFDDVNNAVDDPISFYDPSPGLAEWTDNEVDIYKQRFAKYPKQFGHIAAGLPHKTQAQCVQFYYLYKKALIDFREAVAAYGQSKRRRGGRKTDKKKGGLLADIRQHDAEVSKEQDPVKRRASTAARKRRESARAAQRRSVAALQQEEQTPVTTPTPEPDLESARPKRRRSNRPVTEPEPARTEDEPPVKRSRRAPRKPKPVPDSSASEQKPTSKVATELPGAVTESQSDQPVQRTRSSTAWSTEDKDVFMGLLAQYGKDFKRIAASMPNKTTIQVGNFYAANLERYNLSTIAAQAPGRSPTPQETKKESPDQPDNPTSANHERSFTLCDVPPISATSRSHLMDLQSYPFTIPTSSSGPTLHLYS
ncbi:hypothetical protein EDB92DRAFT_1948368 [Lactarius akahatsu]|uniref:SANT domain-containing protein n=1 Tax=Lactarius akahatsu TaxID=416441 RepID=A0AAD4LBJ9_9AGAM|nr:hypothetical protein EDB92DRAFT_1948368 [Lactarius akahatsu]